MSLDWLSNMQVFGSPKPKEEEMPPSQAMLMLPLMLTPAKLYSYGEKPNTATTGECLHWFCNTAFQLRRAGTCRRAELLKASPRYPPIATRAFLYTWEHMDFTWDG